MKGKKRKLLVAALVVLTGIALLGIALLRGCEREDPFAPPAPDAPEAPDWTDQKPEPADKEKPVVEGAEDPVKEPPETPSEEPVQETVEEPVEEPVEEETVEEPIEAPAYDPHAKYGSPADSILPLEFIITDLPEVPERIKGPSPPIEEE
jgi:hypothetical protein